MVGRSGRGQVDTSSTLLYWDSEGLYTEDSKEIDDVIIETLGVIACILT